MAIVYIIVISIIAAFSGYYFGTFLGRNLTSPVRNTTFSSSYPTTVSSSLYTSSSTTSSEDQNESFENVSTSTTSIDLSEATTNNLISSTMEGNGTYTLNQNDRLVIGWTLDGVYLAPGTNPNVANSLSLAVTNVGENTLTYFSFELPGILNPIQENSTLTEGASETFQVIFVGGIQCETTSVASCNAQTALQANVSFSDGETFAIPQPIDIIYNQPINPFVYDTNSSFCSQLLSTVNTTEVTISLQNGYLSFNGNVSPTIGIAAYSIFDSLNPNGLHLNSIVRSSWGEAIPIESQDFITGKTYSVWLQLGLVSSDGGVVYSIGGFCTATLNLDG